MSVTDIERYLFDCRGYIVLEQVLSGREVSTLRETVEESGTDCPPAQGGFACIPGSHKSAWAGTRWPQELLDAATPRRRRLLDRPYVQCGTYRAHVQ